MAPPLLRGTWPHSSIVGVTRGCGDQPAALGLGHLEPGRSPGRRRWVLTPAPQSNPESFGLYFVLGVCFGLVLTLCLLVLRLSCQPPPRPPPRPRDLKEDTIDRAASESLLPVTEIPLDSHGPGDGALAVNVFASAEELERAQRLEERERIIREIWRNGQPDILGTGTLGRVHYY
uniref:Eva-1 homolog B n=1 Tax=Strix occidentalis caurina TaxID=311401 RepID=A0A8D0KQ87_STROC